MKKHLQRLLLLAALLMPWVGNAQSLADYTFSVDTTTFSSIVSSGTAMSFTSTDDGYASCTIPFGIPFGNSSIAAGSSIACSANGFIYLGASSTSGTTASYTNTTYRSINALLNVDGHMGRNTGAGCYYRHDATAGTFTIEYHLLARYSSPYGAYSYQVVFHTNGTIDIIYDSVYLNGATPTFRVFLNDGPTADRLYLSSSWANPTVNYGGTTSASMPTSNLPVHGLRYTFAAPVILCPKPISLTASNLTTDAFDITWVDTTDATMWIVRIDTVGGNMDEQLVYDTNYSFSMLTPNTPYTVSVAGICTSGDTSLWRTLDIRTLCTALDSLPYTYGFEGLSTGSSTARPFINCWHHLNNGSQYFGWPYVSSTAHNGSRSLYWYASTTTGTYGDYQIVVLPSVDTDIYPINTLQLKFWAKASGTSYSPVYQVGVMTDPNDATTFQAVSTVNVGNSAEWQLYEVPLVNFTGNGQFVALRANRPTSAWYAYTDDFTLELIPACPHVSNLRVDSVSVDWAAISWTEVGTASSWYIEYDTVPFTPGTSAAANSDVAYDTTYLLNYLDTGRTYYVYVAADCGSDTSTWESIVVTTLAGLPAEVPYLCNFEGGGTNGWDFIQAGQANYWMVGTATHNGGSKSMYVTDNGTANSYSGTESYSFATRTFNLTDTGEYAYSFDWKCNGESSYDFLRAALVPVGTVLTAGNYSGFNNGEAPSGTMPAGGIALDGQGRLNLQGSSWQTRTGTFRLSQPGTYKWVFLWRNDPSVYNVPPAAIDNVSLIHNTCPGVQGLEASYVTSDSIVIVWQPGGSETIWIVSNGVDTTEVYDTTYTFDNLFANTPYNILVWALCDNGDTSIATSLAVRTACGAMVLPFSEDFNSYAANSFPACWTRILNSNNYPYISSSDAESGNCLKFGGLASAITPRLSVPLNQVVVSFDLQVESTSSSGAMHFGYTRNPNSVDSMVDLHVFTPASTYTYYHYEFDLSNDSCADTVYLVWRPDGSTSWYYWMDNLVIDRASTCPAIEGLRTSAVSNSFATVAWTDTASAQHVEYMVYIATTDNIAAAFDSASVIGATNYTFTGLHGSTHYYVWVKGVCYDADSRFRSIDFTTSVDCVPVSNLHATPDYHSFTLSWDAPTTGEPVTGYIVEYKLASASTWTTATTTNNYYYVGSLTPNTLYDYRVHTECDTVNSTNVSGSVQTSGCATLVTEGGATHNYLPTQQYYEYSYTQQIYLNSELTGLDTITDIAFHVEDGDTASSRNVVIYMGNTTQSSFSSTSNYIPSANLQQVYSGTLSGTGWLSFHLATQFVRTAGSNLVVAVDDNTGSWTSSISWTATATSNARALYFYQDDTDITPASPSASNSGAVNYVNQIKLTNLTCVIPDCGTPTPTVTDVQANQATIAWEPEAGQVYTVAYRLATDTAWTIVDSTNTTGTYTFQGLTPALDYVARVSTDCNGQLLSGTVSFSTACAPAALPYTEDFENHSGVYNRTCWTIGSTNLGSSYPNPTVVNLTGDPNKLCLFWNGAYAIMPRMDAPLNQLQIRFYFVQGGDNVRFLMGLMDDPTAPISTMRVLDTIIRGQIDSTTSYINYTYRFDNLAESDSAAHIAFWDAFNDNYSFLDNIVVEYIPNCQPVTGLTATNVTASSADIDWVDNNTASTGYIVEYGLHGFTAGTGTRVNTTMAPYTLTGLNHSTSYDAYVYTVCGTDTAIASQVINFSTACGAITALPYTMNFEGYVSAGSTATNILPTCWNTEATGAYIYYNTNNSQAPSQSYALQLMGSGIVVLPEMGVPLDSLMVTFHDYNVNGYGLVVGTIDASATSGYATSFVPVDTILFEHGVNASTVSSYLTDYTGTDTRIALMAYGNSGTGVSHYIDNLVIDRIPSCIAPQRVQCAVLTNVSADITWRTSQAASYSVEYGPHGFVPGTGTASTVTTRSLSLTGLMPLTQYDVRLVSLCSATEVSDTTVFTFTTMRAAPVMTYPYICDFSDSTIANAWEPVNGTQANKWYVGTAAHYGTADNMGMYISSDNGTSNNYNNSNTSHTYAYRSFNMPAGSYNISFKWQADGEGGSTYAYDYLRAFLAPGDANIEAGYCPDGTTSSYNFWNVTPAGWISLDGSAPLRGNSSWQSLTTDVSIATSGTYHLVFYWGNDGSSGSNPPAAVDNIEVFRNSCAAPVNITAVTAGATYLDVDWTDVDSGTVSWQLRYGLAGTSNDTIINVASHPVSLTGLDTLTSYSVSVRPICSGSDTGRWSSPVDLMTSMCDNANVVDIGSESSSGTTYYYPVNNYYNYTLTETIIDSAEIGEPMDITYLGYYYNYTTPSSSKNNCTIYFQPTSRSVFASASDVVALDTNTAVRVYVGPLNCSQGWNFFELDTTYYYNGTGNLLVIVDDNSGSYNSSSHVFKTAPCTGNKTLVYYSDSSNPDVMSPSGFSGSTSVYTSRVVMRLINCGSAGCRQPNLTSSTGDYQSHTITWSGNGTAYEVACKTTDTPTWPTAETVTTTSKTFTGLQPATVYMFRVRQDCTVDSLGYSNWVEGFFTTDSLPCLAPDSLTALSTTNTTATFGWTARGNETAWDIRVFSTTTDTTYTVTTNPATVGGLHAGMTYYAAIRALCGNAQNIPGDWSDSIQFATQICPTVTGVTTSNVTFNSVTLNWPAATLAQGYEVEYGMHGFTQGNGTSLPATTNSLTVSGLMDETQYDFYVRAVCGTNWHSENWSTLVTVTTLTAPSTTFNITATVNPTNAGTVTGTGVYAQGDTATLTATANTGYTFNRWNDNVTLNPRSVVVTSDSAFTAFFTRNQYTVTVTSADQTRGTVTGNGTYYYGDTATLTATAATGYHFTQWNDGDTHVTRSIVVTGDTTFTASFGVNQYTVTATANDASYGTVTGGGTYNFRDTVTLTATANTGYYFRSWNDGNVDNPRTFVVTGDVTYTALFAADSVPPVQTYTVTLNANDANMGIVNGAGTFAEGTSVEISAIANAGYRFVNWNDGVTENPRTFVLTCDTTFTANFAELVDSSAVLVVSFDSEMGYVLINGTEASSYNGLLGDEVSLEAIANEGYHFVEWSDGETSRTRTITLEQSRTTLTATFAVGANGIATVEGSASCLIYPNPASSSTTISVSGVNGKVRIAVVDINGRVAASETMECAGDCVKTMNVDNLSQGAYFVRITGEKVNMVKKLIVR